MIHTATYLHDFFGNTYPIEIKFNDSKVEDESGLMEVISVTGDMKAANDFFYERLLKKFHQPKIRQWQDSVVSGTNTKKEKRVKAQF